MLSSGIRKMDVVKTVMGVLAALVLGTVTTAVIWRLAWLPINFFAAIAALVFSYLYWSMFFAPGLAYDPPTRWSIVATKVLLVPYFPALAVIDYRIVVSSGVKWLLVALAVEAILTPFWVGLSLAVGRAAKAIVAKKTLNPEA